METKTVKNVFENQKSLSSKFPLINSFKRVIKM